MTDRFRRIARRATPVALAVGSLLAASHASAQVRVSIGEGTSVLAYEVGLTIDGTVDVQGTFDTRGSTLRFTSPDASGGLVLSNGLRVVLTDPQSFAPTAVTGPVQLQGVLQLEVPSGSTVAAGATYTVLTCSGGCAGTFERVEAPFTAEVTYGATAVSIRALTGTAVDGSGARPRPAALHAPAPNPFTDRAVVALELASDAHVRVEAFDVLGRRVGRLHEGPLGAGRHTLVWDAQGLSAGVYVLRAVVDGAETRLVRTVSKR